MKPWLNRIASSTQVVLWFSSGIAAWSLCLSRLGDSLPGAGVAFLIICLLLLLAMAAHELGHYAGARLAGMTVRLINVGGLEFHVQRRGWRVRWSRITYKGIGGYVLAFPQFGRPMRPQMVALILGGPIANLASAALCGVLGWVLLPWPGGYVFLAFSIVSLATALVSLVPHQGSLSSDGLNLLCWLRGVDEAAPILVHTRLISRSIAGQTADELPEDELATMEELSTPMPLVALWYRLKSDQNRGDWAGAVSRAVQFEEFVESLDPHLKTVLAELLITLRAELAFSRAMLTGDDSGLNDDRLPPGAFWASPWLRPRCQALSARLRGDEALCMQLLEISKWRAEDAIDSSLRRSEAVLRTYIAAASQSGCR